MATTDIERDRSSVENGLTSPSVAGKTAADLGGRRPFLLSMVLAAVFHGGLLFSGTWRGTYDAWVHIFFADHYQRSWFQLFEPRWYTGFSVASYPPASHQAVAAVGTVVGLEVAFVVVQLAAVLLLVGGVYRFSAIWASERSAGFATLGMVLSTALAQTVHVFGQLPTVLALALLLHASPPVVSWLRSGDVRALGQSVLLVGATAAVHHVTIIFGAVFVLGAIGLGILSRARSEGSGGGFASIVGRGGLLAVLSFLTVGVVLIPYWLWSASDPIRQVPIPHGSRDNFLSSAPSALMFLVVPWGAAILGWVYAVVRGVSTGRWPLALSLVLLTALGLGGTTPIAQAMLGPAFEVLALDRFTLWAVVVAAPLLGDLLRGIWDRGLGRSHPGRGGQTAIRACLVAMLVVPAFATVNLPQLWKLQPDPVDTAPVIEFLEKDRHWQWRYLTLGFGDQLAGLAAKTRAANIEGNYHSARRLPVLVSAPIERLDGAKFSGEDGVDALRQVLTDPDDLGLKYVFSNDEFYDPLLAFTGWSRAARLRNGVAVWERAGVALPAPALAPSTGWQDLWWGVVPPMALAVGVLALGGSRWRARHVRRSTLSDTVLIRMLTDEPSGNAAPVWSEYNEEDRNPPRFWLLAVSGSAGLALVAAMTTGIVAKMLADGPGDIASEYVVAINEGRWENAYDLVDPQAELTFDRFLSDRSLEVGLNNSYTRIQSTRFVVAMEEEEAQVTLELELLDAFGLRVVSETIAMVERDGVWFVEEPVRPVMPIVTDIASRPVVSTPWLILADDLEDEDQLRPDSQAPTIQLLSARAVERDGLVHVLGLVGNQAGVPAHVAISAVVRDGLGLPLAEYAAGDAMVHHLLPGEQSVFRITFDGVSGLVGSTPLAAWDLGRIDLRIVSVVTDRGLDRPLVLTGTSRNSGVVSGFISNVGSVPVVVPSVLAGWIDNGELTWVERIYLERGLAPGASAPFLLPPQAAPRALAIMVQREGPTVTGESGSATSQQEVWLGGAQFFLSVTGFMEQS